MMSAFTVVLDKKTSGFCIPLVPAIDGIEQMYPEPYFKIENNKVLALYGNDINELLELKKLTILKSRGKFK